MPSSRSTSQSDSENAVSDALAPPADTVRSCADRERRLTEYIRAHTGEEIAVRLTPHAPTACVIPTSEEALIESDNAEFSDDQARQLVESVEADYLVLISTHPANVDNLPIDDQLTADRAQQFGYALHELGHIRYTAIADAAARLEDRVDKDHQEFVHGLWNSCEDAAIENQLAVDQSQIAADRLDLVSRSISTHADEFAAEECYEFTFRDAIEQALYDEGIYDTGVRDALCDPDDDRIVFAGDADRQAFEQIADSVEELIATILKTPDPVERVEHVLDWWETVVKPLLDPSEQDDQDNQQETEQPDPDGAAGESSASASANTDTSSNLSSDGRETDQSTAEDADSSQSSERRESDESSTVDSTNGINEPENGGCNESATTEETGATSEIDETVGSQSEQRPDPDAINTDQRQPSPRADALDYPDIGGSEDADALDWPESDGEGESEPKAEAEADAEAESAGGDEGEETTESQSARESADATQATEGDRNTESGPDAADGASAETATDTTAGDTEAGDEDANGEAAGTVGGSDNDTGRDGEGDTDDATENGTNAGSREETVGSDDEQSAPEHGSDVSHRDTTSAAGESSEQDSEGEPEDATPESPSNENPWGTTNSNGTSQTSLGSFSAPDSQTENESGSSGGGESDDTSTNASDTKRDGPSTNAGDASELDSESEAEPAESDTRDNPGDITPSTGDESSNGEETTDSGNSNENSEDEEPTESSDVGSNIGDESGDHEERTASDTRTTDEDGSDANAGEDGEERGDTPTESTSESDEQSPELMPAHADGDNGLDREGALDTDREAAHDEAERATPDEDTLEHELEDVADALDALAEQGGGGAAPGSLSELAIMPDTGGSSTTDTAERWGAAAADAEFVADALRKALKESRRDAHRSGVTSGTFDRQRAGALARGDVGAFHVRQPGDDKQYDLVMILDRSGSMWQYIQTAENALVRFALACEDIGINVGVIDFTEREARLIKPFSVECEHVRASLFSDQAGGGTPLADALGLGRELLEQRRNSPLVLVVTDGKPDDEDAYHDELAQSYALVCGLTLVLDQPSGSVPEKVARNKRFYDRHVYVHEPSQLADRLDQFAVMFDGL